MFKHVKFTTKLLVGVVVMFVTALLAVTLINLYQVKNGFFIMGKSSLSSVSQTVYNALEMQNDLTLEKLKIDLALMNKEIKGLGDVYLDNSQIINMTIINQITKQRENVSIPTLKIGSMSINNNFELVDKIKNLVGGTATIFQVLPGKLLRVSTNVRKLDGSRAVGTYIPSESPVYKTVMNGETFYGRAYVVNAWYLTAYTPLRDKNGQIVAVIYVGRKILTLQLRSFITNTTAQNKINMFAYNSKGDILIHSDNELQGKNIFTFSYGELFSANKQGLIEYNNNGVKKIAYIRYFKPWDWYLGVEIDQKQLLQGLDKKIFISNFLVLFCTLIIGSGLLWLILRTIIRPLRILAKQSGQIAQGNFHVQFSYEADDAIGDLARSFQVMVENFKNMLKEIRDGVGLLSSSSAELNVIADEIKDNSDQAASRVNIAATGAESLSVNMNSVAASMQEASTNINTVASASEEFSSTISEIAENTAKAKEVASNAVGKASEASERVNELGHAANEINQVTETITSIASQTNLLALNATIEAARAGEAGKGFAVVANEIKELASQTANATEEIKQKVQSIQQATGMTVQEIEEISAVIKDIDDIIAGIAAAIEEQSVSIKEVSDNIGEAARGVVEVSENISESSSTAEEIAREIADVNNITSLMTKSSANVLAFSEKLLSLADRLKNLLEQYQVGKGMECELLPKCGFFKKYAGSKDSLIKGFINSYCKGPYMEECKRKQYRQEHGEPPSDDMMPNGKFVKE
ncbi:methyl-accepting chemotaxis protein [Desulfonauticus submarinus]